MIKIRQQESQDIGEAIDQLIYEGKKKENDNQQLKQEQVNLLQKFEHEKEILFQFKDRKGELEEELESALGV